MVSATTTSATTPCDGALPPVVAIATAANPMRLRRGVASTAGTTAANPIRLRRGVASTAGTTVANPMRLRRGVVSLLLVPLLPQYFAIELVLLPVLLLQIL